MILETFIQEIITCELMAECRQSITTNYSTKVLFTVHRSLDPSNGPIWCFLVIGNGPVQSFRYEDIFTVELSS